MTLLDSNPIYDRLTLLAACLCAQLEDPANGVPGTCFCGIVPGESVPAEYAGDCNTECGIAWVRMVSAYPSNIIGVANVEPSNCAFALGIDVEIGILRCITVGDPDGDGPSPAELHEAAQLQIADALVMQRAIFCCDGISNSDVILGLYTSLGPEGGLVGGSYNMSMGL